MKQESDKAGKDYWDSLWEGAEIPAAVNPQQAGMKNVANRRFDRIFTKFIPPDKTGSAELLEVGCAFSIWLPYFAKRLGVKVTGLDYSEKGCEAEQAILKKAGVEGEIICANFFEPPNNMLAKFDYLTSFGVAEHFIPTERCISAFAAFLKKDGLMFTLIPNISGFPGFFVKHLNRPLYDKHVVISPKDLAQAHETAGLEVIYCAYFMTANFYVITANGLDKNAFSTKAKEVLFRNLGRISLLILSIEDKFNKEILSKTFSPYIFCVAKKKI